MSVEVERATLPCNVCGAAVIELRRGRCWGCYTRWTESRPVGRGASCTVCAEKRRGLLKLVELKGRSLPFCHGCAAMVIRLVDVPETITELRDLLRRERRHQDRREGKADGRLFPRERRVGERRGPPRAAFADTDPRIRLGDYDDIVVEIANRELEESSSSSPSEQTQVRARTGGTGAAMAAGADAAAIHAAAKASAALDASAAGK